MCCFAMVCAITYSVSEIFLLESLQESCNSPNFALTKLLVNIDR